MKPYSIMLPIVFITFLISCNKEETEQLIIQEEIEFSTDKNVYHDLEDIAVNFQNNTSFNLHVNWCRLYYLERLENGTWEGMGGPPCSGGSGFYIMQGSVISDTMYGNWLDVGKYRLVTYDISMDTSHITIYSNEFEKTDFTNFIY